MSAIRPDDWTRLLDWCGTVADLGGAAGLLGWDRETLMPPAGAEGRAHQLGTLAALHHRELTRPDIDEVIGRLTDGGDELAGDQQTMLRLAARERDRADRVPERLVRALTEARSRCVSTWLAARPAEDVAAYVEALAPVIALKREEAEAIGIGDEPYDALLDEYEPGARAAAIAPVLADLRRRLVPLVDEACERQPEGVLPSRTWAEAAQMALANDIAEMVGFDLRAGVVARSAHPFTGSPHRGDVRFTTRTDPHDPIGSITAVMHEAGHALYEQGFPAEYARTPLYDAPSLGAHESQSRFWENHIGRSPAFWRLLEPMLRGRFPEAMHRLGAGDMHAAATVVRRSPIRVEADEVTYNLHIVVRFELELALIRGDLPVADLPGAFAEAMGRVVGILPPSHADGVMQDIHWPEGLIGYFPTYTLGSLYAAQLAEMADAELPGGLETTIAEGRLGDVLALMRERIHRHGRRMTTAELMERANGRPLEADALVRHLRGAYVERPASGG